MDDNVEPDCSVSSPEFSSQGLRKTLQGCDHLFHFLIDCRIVFVRQQLTYLLDVVKDHFEVKNPFRFIFHRLNI